MSVKGRNEDRDKIFWSSIEKTENNLRSLLESLSSKLLQEINENKRTTLTQMDDIESREKNLMMFIRNMTKSYEEKWVEQKEGMADVNEEAIQSLTEQQLELMNVLGNMTKMLETNEESFTSLLKDTLEKNEKQSEIKQDELIKILANVTETSKTNELRLQSFLEGFFEQKDIRNDQDKLDIFSTLANLTETNLEKILAYMEQVTMTIEVILPEKMMTNWTNDIYNVSEWNATKLDPQFAGD